MKPIKARIDFTIEDNYYSKGDIIEIKDYLKVVSLNEKGFIEPLTTKDLVEIKKDLENPKKFNLKEEENK